MRPLPLLLALLLLVVGAGACSQTSGWPDDERAALRAECQQELGSPTPDQTFRSCTCLYDRLPGKVSWEAFSAWKAEPDETKRDASVSATFNELHDACEKEAVAAP
jgi:hypothetical protein